MGDWHGYPQHEDAHPERPWWRKLPPIEWGDDTDEDEDWIRTDGGRWGAVGCPSDEERQARLAAYDAAHPLPPPEPRCGQVWVWPDDLRLESMVVGITTASSGGLRVWWGTEGAPTRLWPLLGAVLVAGPGAPWAPMGGDDDR